MLLKYSVRNFKSIGNNVEFSMMVDKENEDERLVRTISTNIGEIKVLNRSGLFGLNASGKSSFVQSIEFARNYIVNGQKSEKATGVNLFKGNIEELKNKAVFQFTFYIDSDIYEYGFSIDPKQIHEEWLMKYTENGIEPLFTRITDTEAVTKIEVESLWAEEGSEERNLAELLKLTIKEGQKNQLFLYKLYENGIEKAKEIIKWFEALIFVFPNNKVLKLSTLTNEDKFVKFINNYLNKLNIDVFEILTEDKKISLQKLKDEFNIPREVINDINETENGLVDINGKYFIFKEEQSEKFFIKVKFKRKLNEQDVKFDIDEEFGGIQHLINFLTILFLINNNLNIICFIDEVDRSLNIKLLQFLLSELAKQSSNTLNQIIFTAHDVNLINLDNFRQDEIWFIEKGNIGESKLRHFSDVK